MIDPVSDADIDAPTLCGLIINTAKIAPAAAADLIVNALAALSAKAQPKAPIHNSRRIAQ